MKKKCSQWRAGCQEVLRQGKGEKRLRYAKLYKNCTKNSVNSSYGVMSPNFRKSGDLLFKITLQMTRRFLVLGDKL